MYWKKLLCLGYPRSKGQGHKVWMQVSKMWLCNTMRLAGLSGLKGWRWSSHGSDWTNEYTKQIWQNLGIDQRLQPRQHIQTNRLETTCPQSFNTEVWKAYPQEQLSTSMEGLRCICYSYVTDRVEIGSRQNWPKGINTPANIWVSAFANDWYLQ